MKNDEQPTHLNINTTLPNGTSLRNGFRTPPKLTKAQRFKVNESNLIIITNAMASQLKVATALLVTLTGKTESEIKEYLRAESANLPAETNPPDPAR
jgi:hypothetical protein